MKATLPLLFTLLPFFAHGQQWQWGNLFGSLEYRRGKTAIDPDGNILSLVNWRNWISCFPDPNGECPSPVANLEWLSLVKTSPQGLILDVKSWETGSIFYQYFAQGMKSDAAGNLYLLVENRYFGNWNLTHEIWKLDADWNTIAQVSIPTTNGVYSHFEVDAAGNVYIAFLGNTDQLHISKYDPSLNLLWNTKANGAGPVPTGLALAPNGKLYFTGTCNNTLTFTNNSYVIPGGVPTGFIATLDAATGLCSASGKLKNPVSIEPGLNGQLVVTGNFGDEATVLGDALICNSPACAYLALVSENLGLDNLAKLENGLLLFNAIAGADGSIYVAGQDQAESLLPVFNGDTVGLPPLPRQIYAAKFSPNLVYQWSTFFGSTGLVPSGNENYIEGVYDLALGKPGVVYVSGLSKAEHLVIEGDTLFNYGNCLFLAQLADGSFTSGGKVWFDFDGNGLQDAGEQPFPLKGLLDETGSLGTFTNRFGRFSLPVETGSHSLSLALPPAHFSVVPPLRNFTINQLDVPGPDTLDFRLVPDMLFNDLAVEATPSRPPVPGVFQYFKLDYTNNGTLHIDGTLYFRPNNLLWFTNIDPPSATISGDTISWHFTNLAPGEHRTATVEVYVSPGAMLNDTLTSLAWVTLPAGDSTPADNIDTLSQVVLSSFDPNDKLADPSGAILLPGQSHLLDEPFEYLVRFQNTGTYTAFKVVIRDTLSALLKPETFTLLAASHPVNLHVREGNILEFVFNNIMLPDSTTDEPGSHGFVKYQIRPVQGLQVGDVVENTAHIYFDYNEPVTTNTVQTKIEQAVQTVILTKEKPLLLRLSPNPAADEVVVSLDGKLPAGQLTLSVTDFTGKVVREMPWQSRLEVGGLPAGVYSVVLKKDGKVLGAGRFVKR